MSDCNISLLKSASLNELSQYYDWFVITVSSEDPDNPLIIIKTESCAMEYAFNPQDNVDEKISIVCASLINAFHFAAARQRVVDVIVRLGYSLNENGEYVKPQSST